MTTTLPENPLPTSVVPAHLGHPDLVDDLRREHPGLEQHHVRRGQWHLHAYRDTRTGATVTARRHHTEPCRNHVLGDSALWATIRAHAALWHAQRGNRSRRI